ncbi:Biotin-requiring enzyme [Geosporobacter subterraneus DSM 17957]|uniref:Biotin-requiring enzyme n=1 Tax=Geosporobacter subterraneus DSM 17957 TaxID=1121919 RepID=A0A1M6K5W1_9FIRM|nr:lipoyl domain-containing protein [Geosporobacter subterraneus]SHJ54325.1 Biotin-requiring enzyme [Geosporobacter subterraneus DSM 17957]
MNYELKVPKFAEGATIIKIKQWLCQTGDHVREGEAVAEASTDKIAIYIESPIDGLVHSILAAEGEEVYIDQVIAIISSGEEGENVL